MPPRADPVDEILADLLLLPVARQRGRLEALCEEHPRHASDLRRRFELLGILGVPLGGGDGEQEFPERLGDFRLLERLGSGGMGVVYRAEQLSLGREVALKLIRPEHLYFPGAKARFRREVEAVARLQHPGIVPVYTVGEESGIPFFAMELVDGCTLAEALRRVEGRAPESLQGVDLAAGSAESWCDTCLGVVLQIAEALHHAHERGILHRDVKPSNVLLSADGRARLLDFGLTSVSDEQRLTRTGEAVGTVHYMPPEQLLGRAVDHRADVYSLGVTLYELLSLQAPYLGEDRSEIEKRIRDGRPDPIRVRNRRVPSDAEQVCLCAMAPEPGLRYESAAAFSADLENVLARRPIVARPPGPVLRMRRWVQRHPAVTAALAGGALLIAGIPTALLLQARGHNTELQDALTRETDALAVASRERDTAQQRADQYEAMTDFLVGLFEAVEPDVASGGDVPATRLLEEGAESIEFTLRDQPRTRAALLATLGLVHLKLGRADQALTLVEDSLASMKRVEPLDDELLAETSETLAAILASVGRADEAERRWSEVLDLVEDIYGPRSTELAGVRVRMASFLQSRLRFEEAEELFRTVVDDEEMLAALPTLERASHLAEFGGFLTNKSQNLPMDQRRGLFEEAEPYLRAAVETLKATPDAPLTRLANYQLNLGLNVRHQDRLEEAAELYRAAKAAFTRIEGPEGPHVGICYANEAGIFEAQGRYEEAVAPTRAAARIVPKRFGEESTLGVYVLGNLAGTLFRAGRYAEAEELYGRVIPLQERVFPPGHPAVPVSYLNRGTCQRVLGAWEEAAQSLQRSLVLWSALQGADHPATWKVRVALADLHLDRKELGAARECLTEIDAIFGDREGLAYERRAVAVRRAQLRLLEGDAAGSAEDLRAIRDWLREHEPGKTDRHKVNLILARALREAGRYEESEATLEAAQDEIGREYHRDTAYPRACAEAFLLLYSAWGRPQEAARFEARLAEIDSASDSSIE